VKTIKATIEILDKLHQVLMECGETAEITGENKKFYFIEKPSRVISKRSKGLVILTPDEVLNLHLQRLDGEDFEKFLKNSTLGDQWAPAIHTIWNTYKQRAGVETVEDHADNYNLGHGLIRYWFKTARKNLWYCEVRQKESETIMSRYFHFYGY